MRSARPLLPMIVVALACSGSTDLVLPKTPASISFLHDSVTTFPGGTVALPIATVYDSAHEVTHTSVTWTSLTPSIASVVGRTAEGHSLGVATFEATSGPVSGTIHVGVTREPVVAMETNFYSQSLYGLDSTQFIVYPLGPLHDTLDREVTLRTLTPDIATITASGMIHARASGTAQISAATDDYTATFLIAVDARRVARIVAIPDSLTLMVGQYADSLSFRVLDAAGAALPNRYPTLSSSNRSVLEVDYYLGVFAVHPGTAYIIATSDTAEVQVPVTVIPRP